MIIEIIILSAFLVFLFAVALLPHKCPKCGGKIKDVVLSKNSVICRCDNCGNFGYKE